MNIFCRIFGHTWVFQAENPKTSWNVDDKGFTLEPTPDGNPAFAWVCARCQMSVAIQGGKNQEPPRFLKDAAAAGSAAPTSGS